MLYGINAHVHIDLIYSTGYDKNLQIRTYLFECLDVVNVAEMLTKDHRRAPATG